MEEAEHPLRSFTGELVLVSKGVLVRKEASEPKAIHGMPQQLFQVLDHVMVHARGTTALRVRAVKARRG